MSNSHRIQFSGRIWPTAEQMRHHFLHQVDRDLQIRLFGWALLLVWILAVLYMTRSFWLSSLDGLFTKHRKSQQLMRAQSVAFDTAVWI